MKRIQMICTTEPFLVNELGVVFRVRCVVTRYCCTVTITVGIATATV